MFREKYPAKFTTEEQAFAKIRRGDHVFIGTACGEPQYLVNRLTDYVARHPTAIYDAELFQVWTLGVAPYADPKFKANFRHNSFFIGSNTRDAVNKGAADYTPIFLSGVPGLFRRGVVKFDVALIQVSSPDRFGNLSLGVSVDIVKAAVEHSRVVIAQVNEQMPRALGDSFIHIDQIDHLIVHDEPLLEFHNPVSDEIAISIGKHVARVIRDGDTIQVGYGSVPNAILSALAHKKHLGVHTELLTEGIINLMKSGAVDNTHKTIDRGKTVATFCMGDAATYEYLSDNPCIEMRPVDYTNNPLVIAQHENMVAINSALEIDLTGQATADSLGGYFYSGIGGQADFMRGVVMTRGGRTILAMQASARAGDELVSRIVPQLKPGAGVTLCRGDIHYVVTEYGIAYLHGKNIRERAMDLIAIAHPKFQPWLIEQAKELNLIYRDQAFIPGKRGEYPANLETDRTARSGLALKLRPVKISDEPILKDFFYELSDKSIYRRFISSRKDMPHERLQEFVIIDYTRELVILALVEQDGQEHLVGVGQYGIHEESHTAEVAFVVRDDFQGQGIGTELLQYLTFLARKQGLLGFTAEVLVENRPMLHLFEKMGFDIDRRSESNVYELRMVFRG
ncbi:MAG: GNAT family N-acetyltransferase [Deltaproteobacteria bacterium]|nr:GNAT family N-acetyltransferase [Deltaproteobacteria bacterium]